MFNSLGLISNPLTFISAPQAWHGCRKNVTPLLPLGPASQPPPCIPCIPRPFLSCNPASFLPHSLSPHFRDKPPACCFAFFTWVPGTARQWQACMPGRGVGPGMACSSSSKLGGPGGSWAKGECCWVDSVRHWVPLTSSVHRTCFLG